MKHTIKAVITELKVGLEEVYGDRLLGVYLYGSYARDEADAESDVDVLIILEQYGRYAEEIGRTSELISSLSMKYNVSISRIFLSQKKWLNDSTPFLRNIRAEAISA